MTKRIIHVEKENHKCNLSIFNSLYGYTKEVNDNLIDLLYDKIDILDIRYTHDIKNLSNSQLLDTITLEKKDNDIIVISSFDSYTMSNRNITVDINHIKEIVMLYSKIRHIPILHTSITFTI